MIYERLVQNIKINEFFQFFVQRFILNSSYRIPKMRYLKVICRNIVKAEIAKLIREKYSDCYCIFTRHGLGDLFFLASYIKEFKKTHEGKVVIFTEKQKLVNFIKAFPSIDDVVCSDNYKYIQEIHFVQESLKKGKLAVLYYPYRGAKETYTFADNYANMLDVPVDCERERPVISDENYKNAKEEFERLKINPEKTILIIPEAVMFDYRVITPKFWKNFAKKLTALGYDVVFNSKNKEYRHFKTTFLPVMDFLAFAEQIKYIYSFRSGITDVFAGIGINNMTVIYPPYMEVIWTDPIGLDLLNKYVEKPYDSEFDNLMQMYSLNTNFKGSNIHEFIYNFDDELTQEEFIKKLG